MIYRNTRNYENLNKRIYEGVGEYGIPEIYPEYYTEHCNFISFNEAKQCKDEYTKGVHFFIDDYRFNRLWESPDKYIPMLQRFRYVMTPDFSVYADFPKVVQIYNHYRKHWLGAYMQENRIRVIPTIGWSTPDSYEWCFDGEPEGAAVAVSSIGTQRGKESRELFISGYMEMVRRLQPETIIFYGNVPEECTGNIVKIQSFQEKFKEVRCNGR